MLLSVVSLVGEYVRILAMTVNAARTRRAKASVVDVVGGDGAGQRHTLAVHRDVVLCAALGSVRQVRPLKPSPRLARSEHASRIRSGWRGSMPISRACTLGSMPVPAQLAQRRRSVAPPSATAARSGSSTTPSRHLAPCAFQWPPFPDGATFLCFAQSVAGPATLGRAGAGACHRDGLRHRRRPGAGLCRWPGPQGRAGSIQRFEEGDEPTTFSTEARFAIAQGEGIAL
jgi:hypothetical protein